MKKVFLIILAMIGFLSLRSQVTVTIGSALLQNPGTDIHFPVTVTGMNGTSGGQSITALELHISYNSTILVYDTTVNFSPLTPGPQWIFGGNGLEYATNWFEPNLNKIDIPDNTLLFEVIFHYLGGSGELNFDTVKSTVLDSAYNQLSGVHFINGTVTPGSGTDESRWNGTGPWNTSSNWSNGIPGDSTNAIIETGVVVIRSNAVCKSMTVNSGTTLEIAPDYSLTVNKDYANNGTFILQSDTDGTGSLIVTGSASGSGTNHFKRYLDLEGGNSWFVSSPVASVTASVFGSNSVEKYTEDASSWTQLGSSDNLEQAKGFRVSGSGVQTFDFTGSFSTTDVLLSNLSYTGNVAGDLRGLNLAGNPYPSAIRWDPGDWGLAGLDHAIYVWDQYKYATWNGSVGSLTDGIIPAMQAFFVKSNSAGASVTIPAAARLHSTLPYYKSTEAVSNLLSMTVTANTADSVNHYDMAFVHIQDGSTGGFDGNYDAYKLFGDTTYSQIYTQASDQSQLSINTQPDLASIPVEVKTGDAGFYQISFGNIGTFDAPQPLFFEDKGVPTSFDIRNTGKYVFQSPGGDLNGRFVLHFETIGIEEHCSVNAITVWQEDHQVHVASGTGIHHADQISIYSMTGKLVFSSGSLALPATISQANLNEGLYIVKIETLEGVFTRKLMVN